MAYFPLGFNKGEFLTVSAILLVLIAMIAINLQISFRKSRDLQRKNDIRTIYDALHAYHTDFGYFPLSDDEGKILACIKDMDNIRTNELGEVLYDPCVWGQDALRDVFDESYRPYLPALPIDPHHREGASYYYISNGERFQIYGALEGINEPEYEESVISRQLNCGVRICNFGWAFGSTPLDKSLEAYENELTE